MTVAQREVRSMEGSMGPTVFEDMVAFFFGIESQYFYLAPFLFKYRHVWCHGICGELGFYLVLIETSRFGLFTCINKVTSVGTYKPTGEYVAQERNRKSMLLRNG